MYLVCCLSGCRLVRCLVFIYSKAVEWFRPPEVGWRPEASAKRDTIKGCRWICRELRTRCLQPTGRLQSIIGQSKRRRSSIFCSLFTYCAIGLAILVWLRLWLWLRLRFRLWSDPKRKRKWKPSIGGKSRPRNGKIIAHSHIESWFGLVWSSLVEFSLVRKWPYIIESSGNGT